MLARSTPGAGELSLWRVTPQLLGTHRKERADMSVAEHSEAVEALSGFSAAPVSHKGDQLRLSTPAKHALDMVWIFLQIESSTT